MNGRQRLRGWGAKLHNSCLETGSWLRVLVFRDSATLKTKATFKSKTAYLGHWYPGDNLGDIGDGKQAAGAGNWCSELGCAKRGGCRMCTPPSARSWVHGPFLCSGTWILLCCRWGLLILECNVEAEPPWPWTHGVSVAEANPAAWQPGHG